MFHEPLEFSNTAYFEGCATRWAFTDQLVAGGDHLVDTPRLQAASANICKYIKDHKGTFRTLLPKYLGKMPVYVSTSRPNIPQYFWNAKTMDHSTIGRWHCGPLNYVWMLPRVKTCENTELTELRSVFWKTTWLNAQEDDGIGWSWFIVWDREVRRHCTYQPPSMGGFPWLSWLSNYQEGVSNDRVISAWQTIHSPI